MLILKSKFFAKWLMCEIGCNLLKLVSKIILLQLLCTPLLPLGQHANAALILLVPRYTHSQYVVSEVGHTDRPIKNKH